MSAYVYDLQVMRKAGLSLCLSLACTWYVGMYALRHTRSLACRHPKIAALKAAPFVSASRARFAVIDEHIVLPILFIFFNLIFFFCRFRWCEEEMAISGRFCHRRFEAFYCQSFTILSPFLRDQSCMQGEKIEQKVSPAYGQIHV